MLSNTAKASSRTELEFLEGSMQCTATTMLLPTRPVERENVVNVSVGVSVSEGFLQDL